MVDPSTILRNEANGEILARRVVWCESFLSRGRGLMFRRPLEEGEAYFFVLDRESVSGASIHMFFVSFPIAVIWLNGDKEVVDAKIARPWRPYYAPRRPARFFLEGHPSLLDQVEIGDEIVFERGDVR